MDQLANTSAPTQSPMGASSPVSVPAPTDWENDPLWYKDAIIYELPVKAFFDSNNDGMGDFRGLTEKLDYLQELGVNTLWLLPFYPSPMRDDGYDIADYHNLHPAYGTRHDFRNFVREAHRRRFKVITELIINHTSDQHPWFQAARRAPSGSSKRDYYVWSDTIKRYTGTRIIFQDTEISNWAWDDVAKAYYWHRFFSHQPDLNFDNPRVLGAVIHTMRFWLDMGVDGLRLDAIPYLCEREGTNNENLPETHAVIKEIRRQLDQSYPDKMLLAEANQWPEDVREYFGNGDECHMAFHFPLMPRLFMAIAQEDRLPVIDILRQTPDIPDNSQWAIFLRNHDELTLEMVTDSERDYMYQIYAVDPRMRVNVGIRRRLAPLMENDRRRIELISCLLMTMPGSPILYYGDEIGMGGNIFLGDRNGVCTPMQWTSDPNAGFSPADPQRLYLPPIMDPVYGYQAVNVEAQARNPTSLLNWTTRLIQIRKSYRAFGRGTLAFLEPGNRKVLAYLREFQDDSILCVANLSRNPQAVELDLSRYKGRVPVIASRTREQLQRQVLLPHLLNRRWFAAKGQRITRIEIIDEGEWTTSEGGWLLTFLEVQIADAPSQLYFLPLGLAWEERGTDPLNQYGPWVLARVRQKEKMGILYGAFGDARFCRALAHALGEPREMPFADGRLRFACTSAYAQFADGINEEVKHPSLEQSNTGIMFGNKLSQRLGQRLAEMHAAFAKPTDDPAFAPAAVNAAEVAQWVQRVRDDAGATLDLLSQQLEHLREAHRQVAEALLAHGATLLERLQRTAMGNPDFVKTRYHGDLHLGQVLLTGQDFLIVDFEGEPARSLQERRAKHSPLRDVAGMLRSLDYAAALAVQNNHEQPAEKRAAVEKAVRTWQTEASQAFLAGYRQTGAELPSVPRDPKMWQKLLELFLIDKALYELRYEINMRPDWVGVPLRGLLALVQTRAVNTADAG